MRRIYEIMNQKSEIIPFPVVFEKLCRNFSIPKKECWDVLFILRDEGLIQVVPYRGIRVI
jgi:transcription initiation factor IIE alpha subunit